MSVHPVSWSMDFSFLREKFHYFASLGLDALEWAKRAVDLGCGEILLTSMDRDGTKSGFDNKITSLIADAVSVPVIASGGAGKMEDFYDGIVEGKADAVQIAILIGVVLSDVLNLIY